MAGTGDGTSAGTGSRGAHTGRPAPGARAAQHARRAGVHHRPAARRWSARAMRVTRRGDSCLQARVYLGTETNLEPIRAWFSACHTENHTVYHRIYKTSQGGRFRAR